MPVRTSVGSGDWSVAGTWDTGVPVNGDSAVIAASHVVTFDVDQSAWANGLIGLTITGELQASTTAGAYYLKMAGNVTGTGVLRAGTAAVQYPVGCTFTIHLNGAFKLNLTGTGSYQLYAADPTYKVIRLSAGAVIGATILNVDTDVTGDIWAAGNLIQVNDVAGTLPDSEQRTIAAGGIAATTITVTAGLGAAKAAGSLVILVSRNVSVVGNGIGVTDRGIDTVVGGVARCELRGCTNGIIYGSGCTISGTVSGCTGGIHSGSGCTISGTVSGCTGGIYSGSGHVISGTVSGCTNGINLGSGCVISGTVSGCTSGIVYGSGHVISGVVSGCTNGIHYGPGHIISGTVSGCSYGVAYGSGYVVSGAVFSGNTTSDLFTVARAQCWNTLFGSAVEHSGYNSADRLAWHYVQSQDHDQVAGAFRAWCRGGVVNSNLVTVFPGRARSYQHVCESATFHVFMQTLYAIEPGQSMVVRCYARRDAAMAGYLPRLRIIDPFRDPQVNAVYLPLAEDIMTVAIDTWEVLEVAYTNALTRPMDVLVRTVAMAAAGNVYFDPIVNLGPTEAASRLPSPRIRKSPYMRD